MVSHHPHHTSRLNSLPTDQEILLAHRFSCCFSRVTVLTGAQVVVCFCVASFVFSLLSLPLWLNSEREAAIPNWISTLYLVVDLLWQLIVIVCIFTGLQKESAAWLYPCLAWMVWAAIVDFVALAFIVVLLSESSQAHDKDTMEAQNYRFELTMLFIADICDFGLHVGLGYAIFRCAKFFKEQKEATLLAESLHQECRA